MGFLVGHGQGDARAAVLRYMEEAGVAPGTVDADGNIYTEPGMPTANISPVTNNTNDTDMIPPGMEGWNEDPQRRGVVAYRSVKAYTRGLTRISK